MASKKEKSILDGVPVKDTTTRPTTMCDESPMSAEYQERVRKELERLTPMGACPHCGAPVYAKRFIEKDEEPVSKHSCQCWRRPGVVNQAMPMQAETKAIDGGAGGAA